MTPGLGEFLSCLGYIFGYFEISPRYVSGLRIDMRNTMGDPTFIYRPSVEMRWIPAMKYQDDNILLAEFEQHFKVYRRWSLLAFGGLVKSFAEFSDFGQEELVYSYGTGFRYYLFRM